MEWNDNIENPEVEEKRLKELIQRNPKNAQAHYELGAVYENIGEYSKALEYCQKAIALAPKDETYYAFLVFLYGMREPDDEKQMEAVANLAELEPDEDDWYVERAIDSLDGIDGEIAHKFITKLREQGKDDIAKTVERWVRNP